MANNLFVHYGDAPEELLALASSAKLISWDIETSGLNWSKDKIATCQLYIPSGKVYIVRIGNVIPQNLIKLLSDESICKLFHHALFDLSFMAYHWKAKIANIACTKIASKILAPKNKSHSLQLLLQQHLNLSIDKTLRTSNWLIETLSNEQLLYAANDVLHLPKLFDVLKEKIKNEGRWELALNSFGYIPTRVQLDLLGANDVFVY